MTLVLIERELVKIVRKRVGWGRGKRGGGAHLTDVAFSLGRFHKVSLIEHHNHVITCYFSNHKALKQVRVGMQW